MVFFQVLAEGRYLMAVTTDLIEAAQAARAVILTASEAGRVIGPMTIRTCHDDRVTDIADAAAISLLEWPDAMPGAADPVGLSRLMGPAQGTA